MSKGADKASAGRLRHYRADGGGSVGRPGRYSGFVGLMRYLLPTMAAALLGLVVAWPLVSGGQEGVHVPLIEDPDVDGRLTMVNASYRGTDAKNRPFAVRGAEAFQPENDSPIVHLSGIEADIYGDQARSSMMALTANEGLYQRDAEQLDLSGDVRVRSDAGHEFRTSKAPYRPAGGNRKRRRAGERQGPLRAARRRQFRTPRSRRDHDLRRPGADDPVPARAGRSR